MPTPFIWLFANPYVAGDSMQKALDKVETLWQERKIMSTVDLLGEDVSTEEEVNRMVKIYLDLFEGLKEKSEYTSVSLKPTALGVNISKDLCMRNIRKILDVATRYGIAVTMDMENSPYTEVTLEIYRELKPDYPNFGTVLQTRLFRTKNDLSTLPDQSHIRLCIGIYNESKDIALQKKDEMKEKLLEYTEELHKNNHFVGIATHDEQILARIFDYIDRNNITPEQMEFQFLLGVPREKIQKQILEKGFNCRLYVPFAMQKKDATKYAIRRFEENPRMAVYVFQNLWPKLWFKILISLGILGFFGILWLFSQTL